MAIGVYFTPSMTARQYDDILRKLEHAGAGTPAGRSYHSSFGDADKLAVFDVWESQEAFDEFGKTLMPILQSLGVDTPQPLVMPIHNIIKG